MAIFGISEEDIKKREAEVRRKHNQTKEMLESQIKKIEQKFQELGFVASGILNKNSLEKIYKEQLEQLEIQKNKLAAEIKKFRDEYSVLENKNYELIIKERELDARSAQAEEGFAAKLEIHLAPIKSLQREIEKKEARLVDIQNEEIKKFAARETKLIADFKKLNEKLQAKFNEEQQQILTEREKLAEKENTLNGREKELTKREDDVRQGLSEERTELFENLEIEKHRIREAEASITTREQDLNEQVAAFENKKQEMAEREEKIYLREVHADQDFADKKQQMLQELEGLRDKCLEDIVEAENRASERRKKMLDETRILIQNEREARMQGIKEEIERMRSENDAAIEKAQKEIEDTKKKLKSKSEKLDNKQKSLDERATQIAIKEQKLNTQKSFVQEKEKIVDEKFRKIAEEKIKAAIAENQAIHEARNQIEEQLLTTRLKLEEQRSINNRFHNKSPEEIYEEITALATENQRLKIKLKNRENKQ
jgi:hypothetical protein